MSADYLAMLKSGNALVSELQKPQKGASYSFCSTATSENPKNEADSYAVEEREATQAESGLASHFRLPDGREVWTSPAETQAEIEVRHPGAIPLPDSVTVTEPGTEGERQAIAYCERVARDREAGRVPVSYTATTHCRHCGTVPIFAGAPVRGDACPWCHNRTKGLPIPRPLVQCRECSHFTADPIGDGGIGSCAKGGPPQGQMPAYPYAKRQCADFAPLEAAL